MFLFYDLIFLLYALFYLPVLLFSGKLHPRFAERFGFLPAGLKLDRPVWIHAVSVGEAASVRRLVEELRREIPGIRFVFTTVTPTGNKIISSIAASGDLVTFLPLDFSPVLLGFFRRVDPRCLVIVETELWPNLIYWARRKGLPVVVVNGRISDRSSGRYRAAKAFFKPVINRVSRFCVQSDIDAKRLLALGLDPAKVEVTGNMKFDIGEKKAVPRLPGADPLWTCASTHPGEETLVMEAFARLRPRFPRLRLLLAPRHPQRAAEVSELVARAGCRPVRCSQLAPEGPLVPAGTPDDVLILDTVGRLMEFYAVSDVVFVGGSLVEKGGHNILEPASLGKPVIFGPHMFNFRDIAGAFLEKDAAVTVAGAADLADSVASLLSDTARAAALAASAAAVIASNAGATRRDAQAIKNLLQPARV